MIDLRDALIIVVPEAAEFPSELSGQKKSYIIKRCRKKYRVKQRRERERNSKPSFEWKRMLIIMGIGDDGIKNKLKLEGSRLNNPHLAGWPKIYNFFTVVLLARSNFGTGVP